MDSKEVTIVNQVSLIPFSDIERMSNAFAKSGLFGVKTPEQALALCLIAQAEGLHPAIAARDYNIIDGKPALKADAMLARFQNAGGKVIWNIYSDELVSGTFSHPQGGTVTIKWTIQEAESADLSRKTNWKRYPRAMLRARVISEGIRTVFPSGSVGVYTPEEISSFEQKPEPKEIPSEAAKVAPEPDLAAFQRAKEDSFRDAAYKALAASGWTRDELAEYAKAAWQVTSSKDLSVAQLQELAAIASERDFIPAMAEFSINGSEDKDL